MSLAAKIDTRAGAVLLDARKAVYLLDHGALLIGDIHFEKASYLRERGHHPLPNLDTHDNLIRLEALVRDYRPRAVVALGDSFHDPRADERFAHNDLVKLNAIAALTQEMVWVLGNHDPDIPDGVTGRREDHVELGGFLLTHHPHETPDGVNICGHLHPKARVRTRAGAVSGPCFAVCPSRIIVPSFGAYTGGLRVDHPDFAREMEGACRYYVVHAGHIYPVDARRVA